MPQGALALVLATALSDSPLAVPYTPDEASVIFRTANDAFAREEVPTAIEGYERLLAGGFENGDVHYNLGTAYLRLGRLGPAILHLERALRANPGDSDARANLERAQKLRVDRLVGSPEETSGEEPLLSRIVSRTNVDVFTAIFVAAYLALAAALLSRRFASSPRAGVIRVVAAALAFATALPTGLVVAAHVLVRERTREAIVMVRVTQVREGPTPEAKAAFEVHEGLKVRVLAEDGEFVRVRLANGLEGWAEKATVTPI